MDFRTAISSDTWFLDGKYLIRATAKFIRHDERSHRDVIEACVMVYEGDPAVTKKSPLFVSDSHLYSNNLDIELTEAEHIGRIFVMGLTQ